MRFSEKFKILFLAVFASWSDPLATVEVMAQIPSFLPPAAHEPNRIDPREGVPSLFPAATESATTDGEEAYLPPEAQREIARRQERVEEARTTMKSADKLDAKEDYEGAIRDYQTAMEILPQGRMTDDLRGQLNQKFANASVGLAEQRIEEGRFDEAISLLEQVLKPSVAPNHQGAKKLLKRLNDPSYFNRAVTPEHAARVKQVEKALNEAMGYYALGDFNRAEEEYHRVLNLDRYNTGARRGLEEVDREKTKHFESAYDETRARFMRELMEQWEAPVPRIGLEDILKDERSQGKIGGDGVAYISTKLKEIIIPVISLRDAPLADAVEFLRQKSVELDNLETSPAKKGVNIVIQGTPGGGGELSDTGGGARITLKVTNVPLVEALKYITDLAGMKYKIDPYAVKIVPVTDVGEDLFTNVFSVPPNFLNLAGGAEGGGGAPDDPFAAPTESGPALTARPTAKQVLEEKGIEFPPGSSAFFNPATSQLVARNTQNNMELIETFVDSLKEEVQKQIYISSKFVEIAQTNLYELGFDWLLGPFGVGSDGIIGTGGTTGTANSPSTNDFPIAIPGTTTPVGQFPVTGGNRSGAGAVTSNNIDALINAAGTIPTGAASSAASPPLGPGIFTVAGILTDPTFQLVIRAINQKKGVDLLSAPSVTARSGQRAKIEVIREFIYPTEYDPPELPDRVGGEFNDGDVDSGGGILAFIPIPVPQTGFPVTPANPTAFETRNTGVTLEVDPVIGADGYTIDLNLVPEVVEFQGFINYGSPIFASNLGTGPSALLTSNRILMPIFGTRKVTTAVTIWDGQTVVIGGLIREDVENVEDKVPLIGDVPVVGRLFRSKVNQRQKRNLTVFVTAKLIDPAGQAIRKFDAKSDPFPEEELIQASPLLPPPGGGKGKIPAYQPPQWGE